MNELAHTCDMVDMYLVCQYILQIQNMLFHNLESSFHTLPLARNARGRAPKPPFFFCKDSRLTDAQRQGSKEFQTISIDFQSWLGWPQFWPKDRMNFPNISNLRSLQSTYHNPQYRDHPCTGSRKIWVINFIVFSGHGKSKNYYQTRKWFTMKVGNPEKQNIICIYIICMPTIFQKVRPNHWTMKQLDSGGLIRRSRLSLFSCEAGEGSKITEDGQQKHRATPRQWRNLEKCWENGQKWIEMGRPPKRFMGAMMIDHLSLGYVWTNPEKSGEMTVQM